MIVLSPKMKEHARPPRHLPSAHLVNAEEDSVATRMVDLPKGVLRVSQRLTVIVGRALQTTTCRMVILHV